MEHINSVAIEYFCQELPDAWNILKWDSSLALKGRVFLSHIGSAVQRVVFRYGTNPENTYESLRVHAFSLCMN